MSILEKCARCGLIGCLCASVVLGVVTNKPSDVPARALVNFGDFMNTTTSVSASTSYVFNTGFFEVTDNVLGKDIRARKSEAEQIDKYESAPSVPVNRPSPPPPAPLPKAKGSESA
jgi:hypothetical protein